MFRFALAILFALGFAAPVWAADTPAVTPINEWWAPLLAAILVAVWDILKRKFNLVEPIVPPVTPPATPPPESPPSTPPSQTPILDIAKQLLPILLPLLVTALKPKGEETK